MWYKPEDGDIIKVIPIIKHDGTLVPFYDIIGLYLKNVFIFDDLNKKYIYKIWDKYSKLSNRSKDVQMIRRAYFLVIINGTVKFMPSSASLSKIIISSLNLDNKVDNKFIKIVKEMRRSGSMTLPTFENSEVIDIKWEKPDDIYEWVKAHQPFYLEEHISKNNIFKHMDLVKEAFGADLIADVISDDRDRKISDIVS
jgi:hypothetical protein